MRITNKKVHIHEDGKVAGIIKVLDGKRKHTVNFEISPEGVLDQWGATTEVLSFTWMTAENIGRHLHHSQ